MVSSSLSWSALLAHRAGNIVVLAAFVLVPVLVLVRVRVPICTCSYV